MRKLVTVRKIDEVSRIPGADAIEVATIGGWKVVVKRGEFSAGDLCIYFEIDSFLPDGNPAWQFLVDKQPRIFDGKRGHRLRTVTLRGQISQGFILPLTRELLGSFCKHDGLVWRDNDTGDVIKANGHDLSDKFGVVKWEAPIPAALNGLVEGSFPGYIRKTDQERCQNYIKQIFEVNSDASYEVTLKLDGSSMTVFANNSEDGQIDSGICGRNLRFKICEDNMTNTLVRVGTQSRLLSTLEYFASAGKSYAVQGEIMGPGIQGNREKLKDHQFFIFDIIDLAKGAYVTPCERQSIVKDLHAAGVDCELVKHIPVLYNAANLQNDLSISSVEELLQFADGPSLTHPIREGLVFKRIDGGFSFKAISNKFLSKEKD